MTVIRNNSISGINSITAQSSALNFYDSTGNTLAISADVTGGVTVATGATISGSTDTVIISTNGSERVRINSSGRVGIGTDNPTEELHIRADTPVIRLEDSDTGGQSQIVGIDGNLRFDSDNNNAQASSNISFRTDGSERLNITSGGNIEIANGNLVFSTAGTGIDFSANSNAAGMTSELLDDYEEGTFTPSFIAGTVSGGYTRQEGRYTKVGRLVTFTLVIDGNGNLQGAAQQLVIGGLPFTSENEVSEGAAMGGYPGNFDTTNNRRFWRINLNATQLQYLDASANAVNGNAVTNVNSQLNVCGFYFTDS